VSGGLRALATRLGPVPAGWWLLGLSGGADSVALLLLLLPERDAGHIALEAVHVNHGLRGEESERDQRFCATLCAERGVPFRALRVDLGDRRDENAARVLRMEAFRRALRDTGADGVLLAHHRDDLAETFLMRLLRGSGPEGLPCMGEDESPLGFRVVRPMLDLGREEIRDALRQDGVPWREDRSNADARYLRNQVRHQLLPVMEGLIPGASRRIARAARLLAEEDRAIHQAAETLYARAARSDGLDRLLPEALRGQPPALQSRVLRLWWARRGPAREERSLSADQTEALRALLSAEKGQVNLPGDYHGVRTRRALFLLGPKAVPPAPVPWRPEGASYGGLTLSCLPSAGGPGDGRRAQEAPVCFPAGCELRFRRPGDRIRPFGSPHSRKLQDYFTDRGVEAPWRDRIPLLCRGGEVMLAAGVGAGAVPAWDPAKNNIRLEWRGDMPWIEEGERHGSDIETVSGPGSGTGDPGSDPGESASPGEADRRGL